MGTSRIVPSGRCFEAALLVAGAVAGPGRCAARCGGGQGEHPPAAAGRAAVRLAQRDGFFGTQRAVVQAAGERCQFRPDPGDRGQQRLGLGRAGHDLGIGCRAGSGNPPADPVGQVGFQQPGLDRIPQRAVEYRPLADHGVRRRPAPVKSQREGVQGLAEHHGVS